VGSWWRDEGESCSREWEIYILGSKFSSHTKGVKFLLLVTWTSSSPLTLNPTAPVRILLYVFQSFGRSVLESTSCCHSREGGALFQHWYHVSAIQVILVRRVSDKSASMRWKLASKFLILQAEWTHFTFDTGFRICFMDVRETAYCLFQLQHRLAMVQWPCSDDCSGRRQAREFDLHARMDFQIPDCDTVWRRA